MIDFARKLLWSSLWVCSLLFVFAAGTVAAEPTYEHGESIFIETGVEAPDRNPTWYASMVAKPYAPVFASKTAIPGRFTPRKRDSGSASP